MKRFGFTMLELIMVIVIVGIIGTMVSEIVANVYRNYIVSYRVNELQQKSGFLLEQITSRLKYRIKDSTIARKITDYNDYVKIAEADEDYPILEWIGYSNEALRGDWNTIILRSTPAFSAFIDVNSDDTNRSQFSTPASNLGKAKEIFDSISKDKNGVIQVDLTNASTPAGLFFATPQPAGGYWGGSGDPDFPTTSFRVTRQTDTIFNVLGTLPEIDIYERYFLAWTAYAIVPRLSGSNCDTAMGSEPNFDLCLFYNYQPWNGENYKDHGTPTLLMENVTSFRFKTTDNFMRVKVCVNEGNTTARSLNVQKGGNSSFGFCKEKAIF